MCLGGQKLVSVMSESVNFAPPKFRNCPVLLVMETIVVWSHEKMEDSRKDAVKRRKYALLLQIQKKFDENMLKRCRSKVQNVTSDGGCGEMRKESRKVTLIALLTWILQELLGTIILGRNPLSPLLLPLSSSKKFTMTKTL